MRLLRIHPQNVRYFTTRTIWSWRGRIASSTVVADKGVVAVKNLNYAYALNDDVRQMRDDLGLTQEKASELLGFSYRKYQKIEYREVELKFREYGRIMRIFSKYYAQKQGLVFSDNHTIESVTERLTRIVKGMFGGDDD